jgi:hypothetical protein
MAVQTIYLLATTAVTPNWWGNTQLNGSAPTAANTAYGWVPGTTALTTAFRRGRLGATTTGTDAAIAASYNAATSGPTPGTGSGATTAGDSFRAGPFVGTFAATAWTFNFNVRASVAGAQGHINMRVWKSANANGSSPTQLLANTAGATIILSTTADVNSSISWSPGALTLYTEYLFFQVEWQETTLGTSSTNNVFFRAGTSSITTPDFQPLPTITGTVGGVSDTQTVLLMHADGTAGSTTFTDSSSYAHTLTASGTGQVTTSSPKFGTGSAKFDGSAVAVVDTGNATDFQFGAGQFTIEVWAYFTSAPGTTYNTIAAQWGSPQQSWTFGTNNSGQLWLIGDTTGSGGYFPIQASFAPTLNTWYHLAVDRDASGNMRLYVNGAVLITSNMPQAFFASSNNCEIGGDGVSTNFLGYLDEIRVSKGIARYGGAFTPPTAPFTVSTPLAQDAQTLSAAGTVGAGAITGTLNVTQQAQTIAASGAPRVGGTLAVAQASQSLVAAGSPRIGGTLGVAQAPQTIVAIGGPRVGGTLGVTQQAHTLLATGTVAAGAAITGSLAVTQAPQTLVAMATVAAAASVQARAFVLA